MFLYRDEQLWRERSAELTREAERERLIHDALTPNGRSAVLPLRIVRWLGGLVSRLLELPPLREFAPTRGRRQEKSRERVEA